jgi:type II secretory pathway pseudopilin PulG
MESQPEGGEGTQNSSSGAGKLITTIVLVLLLIASLAFGAWTFSQMQDYKNNSDKKSIAAVAASKQTITAQLQAQFDEQSKSPYKVFKGAPDTGSISFNYPKTWSGYNDTSSEPINAYFYPDIVPSTQGKTAFALHMLTFCKVLTLQSPRAR